MAMPVRIGLGRPTFGSTCGASYGFGSVRRGPSWLVAKAGGLLLLKLFRHATALGRAFPHRDLLVALRFGPGQYRFVLGRFSASEEHVAHCPELSFGFVPTSSAVTQPGRGAFAVML